MKRLFFEVRYLLGHTPWDTGVSPPELLAFLDGHQPGRALELGCGTGTNALAMAQRGWQVTAIDFSWLALRTAQRRFSRSGRSAQLARGDVAEMQAATGTYHLVLDIGCFHSLPADRRVVYARNLRRRLAPAATYLLYTFLQSGAAEEPRWPTSAEIERTLGESLRLKSFESGWDGPRRSAWYTFRPGEG